MGKKTNKLTAWVKNLIYKLDELFAKWFKAELDPKLYSIIGFSLIASIAIVIIALICQACDVNENVITVICAVGAVAMFGYIIKMLLPNIKLIESVIMRILYVVLNFVVVFIAGAITGYAISAVIMLVVAYFVLMLVLGGLGGDSSSGGDENMFGQGTEGKLDDGTIITYQRGPMGEKMYRGDDGYDYESDGSGGFRRK